MLKNSLSKFININKKKNVVPLQKNEEGEIVIKKAGRPRKPNRRIFQLRMDVDEHSALKAYAKKNDMDISEAARQAIRAMLQHAHKEEKIKNNVKEALLNLLKS